MLADDHQLLTGRLAELRAAYGAGLPDQLGLLRLAARGLSITHTRTETRDAIAGIRTAAHKFAGSAPTFGFTAVGASAQSLERVAGALLDAPGEVSADDIAAIQDAIEALIAEARLAALPVLAGGPAAKTILLIMAAAAPESPLCEKLRQAGYAPRIVDPTANIEATLVGCTPVGILIQAEEGTDYLLPLLDRVRAIGKTAAPVVFFARHGGFAARYAASRAGAVGFLTDPAGLPDLGERLRALIAPAAFHPYRVLYLGPEAPALDATTFRLHVESNPANVLLRIAETRPELLLLSMDLEGFDTVDLARMVWQEDACQDIGIFFLSRDPAMHRVVAARGVTDAYFMTRPTDAVALQARITPYLHDRRAGLRASNHADLGPRLARIAGHVAGTALIIRAPAPSAAPGQQKRKILLVDDDRYLVAMLAHALVLAGADVMRAYGGEQGYAAAWQQLPDVIVTDVEMPHGTGDRMIQQLRGNPRTRDIPVIVMTNRRWEDGKDYALEREMRGRLGAAAYLHKPIRPEVLVRELSRL